jgi:hypothetical protein
MPTSTPLDESPRLILKGKKALVCGIANDSSIAYGCASAFREVGADLAITYATEKAKAHVEPLAKALDASIFMPLDVATPGDLEAVFEGSGGTGGGSTSSSIRSPGRRRKTFRAGSSIARPKALRRRWTSRATRSCAWRASQRR